MVKIHQPNYIIEYTTKTVSAILSKNALDGERVTIDVYQRMNLTNKMEAIGYCPPDQREIFRVEVQVDGATDSCDWNYKILRESADRARFTKKR